MLRPSSIRLYERTLRLKAESRSRAAEERMRKEQLKETRNREFATLIGNHLVLSLNRLLFMIFSD